MPCLPYEYYYRHGVTIISLSIDAHYTPNTLIISLSSCHEHTMALLRANILRHAATMATTRDTRCRHAIITLRCYDIDMLAEHIIEPRLCL